MLSPGINGGELRGQPANPGSPGKMAIKTECVFVWKKRKTVQELCCVSYCHLYGINVAYAIYLEAWIRQ